MIVVDRLDNEARYDRAIDALGAVTIMVANLPDLEPIPVVELSSLLELVKEELKRVVPKHLPVNAAAAANDFGEE